MLSLFTLEDYNFNYSNIPSYKVKICVIVDMILGCLLSLIIGIVSLIAMTISACISGFFYQKFHSTTVKKLIFLGDKKNSFLNKAFVIKKMLEISLLLFPLFGFLTLFFCKLYSGNNRSFWKGGLSCHAEIICLPAEILKARLTSFSWSIVV